MIEILQQLNFDSRDIRLITNLYWEQTAAIRIGNDIGEWKPIKRGVKSRVV